MPPSSDEAASQCLSDVDISSISDRTILENFSDQEARLVCLVCYKIFGPEEYATFRSHVTNHKRSALSKVRLRQSHRYVVSAVRAYIASYRPTYFLELTSTCKNVARSRVVERWLLPI